MPTGSKPARWDSYAVWPADLPQKQFMNLSVEIIPAKATFQVDRGPSKEYPNGTVHTEFCSTPMELTGVQAGILRAFFLDSLTQATRRFVGYDFVTGEWQLFKCINKRLKLDLVTPSRDPNLRRYQTVLELEVIVNA